MTWIAAGVAAAATVYSANQAKKASKAQTDAANNSNAISLEQYRQTREDQAPYRERGNAAANQLQYLLGLNVNPNDPAAPTAGTGLNGGQFDQSNRLSGAQLVSMNGRVPTYNADLYANNAAYRKAWDDNAAAHQSAFGEGYSRYSDAGALNRDLINRLQGAMDEERAAEAQQVAAAKEKAAQATTDAQAGGGDFGSLMRDFSQEDLESDPLYNKMSPLIDQAMSRASNFETAPGYEFRRNEGAKALENSAASRGMQLSGANLKALTRFNQDFASNEYDKWYSQSNADRNFVAGQGDAAYNRFNTDNTNKFNRLASVAGIGQQATQAVNSAGAQYASQASDNITGAGNATAAGIVGSANAFNQGISGAYSAYQNNELMKLIRNGGNSGYSGSTGYQAGKDPLGDMIYANGWTTK